MKTYHNTPAPKPRLNTTDRLSPSVKRCIRTMARLLNEGAIEKATPAHYRISIELYSEEADDYYTYCAAKYMRKNYQAKYGKEAK